MSCPVPLSVIDVAATAALYSQAAGVLAGFASSAILRLLTRGATARKQTDLPHTLMALISAFVCLVLSTVEYAVAAAEPGPGIGGRAATFEVLCGTAFGLSVLLLLYGASQLFEGVPDLKNPTRLVLIVTAAVGPSCQSPHRWESACGGMS